MLRMDKIVGSVDSATSRHLHPPYPYLTGHLLDLGELAALAHENGAVLIVDATQSAGQVPIDVLPKQGEYAAVGAAPELSGRPAEHPVRRHHARPGVHRAPDAAFAGPAGCRRAPTRLTGVSEDEALEQLAAFSVLARWVATAQLEEAT
jgi:hypothetical protein